MASEVGAGSEQECRSPRGWVPSIRVVTPTTCWLDRIGVRGQLCYVPLDQSAEMRVCAPGCIETEASSSYYLSLSHVISCTFTFLKCLPCFLKQVKCQREYLKSWLQSVCIRTILLKREGHRQTDSSVHCALWWVCATNSLNPSEQGGLDKH